MGTGTKIVIIVAVIIYVLFFISVIVPLKSQKKFCIVIQKIRKFMDIAVYWFYNICAISTILFIVLMGAYCLLKKS